MRIITTAILTGSALLLFTACGSNEPDMSQYQVSQKIVYAGGKKYLIPRQANADSVVSKEQAKMFKKMNVTCREGDIHWSLKNAMDKLKKSTELAIKKDSSINRNKFAFYGLQLFHKKGAMGCSTVMTNKQKKAHIQEADRKIDMIKAELRYRESRKPIRYEVHHTGDVGVYVYD